MKKIVSLILLSLFATQKIHAQNFLPVATTGYTHDAIAEFTTAVVTTAGPLDGVNVLYSQAHAALIGSLYGLPNNGTLSSATRTFQLQNYNGPNMLFVQPTTQDSLTFITPVSCQSVSLLDFATDAFSPTTMSVTIRFTDNSTQVFAGVTVYDWLYTLQPSFASGFDRMNRSAGTAANEGGVGNPRFFTTDFAISCANQNKKIKRIIIKNTGTASEKLCILAVSAVANPLNAISSPNNLCTTGGTSTLTATGLTSYTWLPVDNFAGFTGSMVPVTPTATTEYTVQSVTPQNCTLSAMITVSVFGAAPILTLTNTANAGGICPTTTVNLVASGAVTYTWAGGAAATITNGIAFAPTGGNYTVTGENACGTTTAVTSVSVHPLPLVTPAASASTLCAGGTLTLIATGNATNYVWSGGSAPSGNGVGFVPPASTTNYSVVGTSALSCTAMATVPVTVYTTPNAAPIASSTLVCVGRTTTLTASGALSYTWASSTQTLTGNPQFTFIPTASGVTTYTVTKANSSCIDTKTISITTNSLPSISAAANPTQVCALRTATLTGTGGTTYTWTVPGTPNYTVTGNNPVVYPASTSIYSLSASDGTCISQTTVSVSALAKPTITSSASSATLCAGQQVTLNATGGNNYTWTATSGTFYTASVIDSPTASIAYAVTGNNASGCTTTTQQIVVVYPSPVITVGANMPYVCSGDPSMLTATGATSYTWDASLGSTTSNPVTVNPASATTTVMTYSVTGSFPATGCQSSQTVQVGVYVPVLTISGSTIACAGTQVSLTANGGDPGSYSWNTGSSTSNFQTLTTALSAPGIFTLSASSTSFGVNCPATQTIATSVYPNPAVTATADRTLICQKESVQLSAGGATSYTWSNAMTGGTITISPNVAINNYVVTGTDANGCVNTATVQVTQSACASIERLEAGNSADIMVYPNPNNGEFTIRSERAITLTLINELGQTIRTISLQQENEYKVSLSDLPAGIYFLYGKADANSFSRKVIVTK